MFIKADIDLELKQRTREDHELGVLGMMLLSYENYEKATAQLTEEDFVHHKDYFKALKKLYEQNRPIHFDSFADLCEELGIIKPNESNDGQFKDITPNKGLQTICKMITCSDEGYDIQLFIDLIKDKVQIPPIPFEVGENTFYQDESITKLLSVPVQYPICKKEDTNIDKYIYNIQEPACHGVKNEILASNRDSQRDTSVTHRDTPFQPSGDENEPESPLSKKIGDWIDSTTGWFTTSQLDSELNIRTETDKANRRKILKRLCDKGRVQRHPEREGRYRYVNVTIEKLDLKKAAPTSLDIRFPFHIEDYVKLYPANVVVVAGTANAGKTAFMLNVIRMNLKNYANRIRYFCSEGGAEELRSRLDLFPMSERDLEKFEAVKKTANFADAIVPDWINIIDFLEMSTDLWVVNDHLTAIQNKLTTGIGIVAIQKKEGARLGRGAEFGLEKPKLYITMDKGILNIIKAKDWRDKKKNPNGMTAKFKLVNGCRFVVKSPLSSKDTAPPDIELPPSNIEGAGLIYGYDDNIADEDRKHISNVLVK